MRTPTTLTFEAGLFSETKDKATALGVPATALVELGLKYVLSLPEERLKVWAASLAEKRGRPAGLMGKNERLTLEGLRVAESSPESEGRKVVWFPTDMVAGYSGIPVRDAYRALRALQTRGLVRFSDMKAGELDRWNRPPGAQWGRVERIAERRREQEIEWAARDAAKAAEQTKEVTP